MKAFLWHGSEIVQNGKCLVAWCRVQRPLELGGLGVLNLKLFGQALRCRWLWLQTVDPQRLWATFNLTDDRQTTSFFNASIIIEVGDDTQTKFWSDPWLDGKSLVQIAPSLAAAVDRRTQNTRTVADALCNRSWLRDITCALTIQAIMEYVQVRPCIDAVQLNNSPDKVIWRWCSSVLYSSSSAYRALHFGQSALLGARELWKTRAPNRCRFFFWLVLLNRCWTSERRHRHGLQDQGTCALCSQQDELLDHLLLTCVYSREVWFKVLRRCAWQELAPTNEQTIVQWWLRATGR